MLVIPKFDENTKNIVVKRFLASNPEFFKKRDCRPKSKDRITGYLNNQPRIVWNTKLLATLRITIKNIIQSNNLCDIIIRQESRFDLKRLKGLKKSIHKKLIKKIPTIYAGIC